MRRAAAGRGSAAVAGIFAATMMRPIRETRRPPASMNAAVLLQNAIALENSGDRAAAMANYRKVLAREPSNIDALFLLGRAYCQQGELEAGAQTFRKIVKLRPDHAPALTLLATARAKLGDPQEALDLFDRAVAAEPRFGLAFANKADLLAGLGRHEEAVTAFDQALAVNAANPGAWCNRGDSLAALGRHAEAVESFQRALALAPNLMEAHFNLANALHKLRRNEEAVPHYRRALELRPGFADGYVNLGSALLPLKRWDEVLAACEQAAKLGAVSAQLHFNFGSALFELARYDESLGHFEKVLVLEPDHPLALHFKAQLIMTVEGRMEEAKALLERAIAVAPEEPANYGLLAQLKHFSADDPQIATMERLLQNQKLSGEEAAGSLHFALAKAYRDSGEHAASFGHLLHGNALVRQQFEYDEKETTGKHDRACEVFTPELLRSLSGHGDPSERPIFIVGMPRSGTTLIEQILASHPRVYGAGERKDFPQTLFDVMQADSTDYPDFVSTMTPAQLKEIGATYLSKLAAATPVSDRFTDKLPGNFRYVGLIKLMLPNARVLHARRNPIDNCVSCFSIGFADQVKFAYDLGELGRYYRSYERLMQHWRNVLPPEAMLDVQYEEVVADIETQARRIVAYCGLEWDDACLAFHETKRPVKTASVAQVRQPIYKTSVERWRPYEKELAPLLEALGVRSDA
jgi:tetratricopeptide (TPR) repeat protein